MKTFFWRHKATSKHSNPLAQRVHWSSFAATLLVMLIASAWPATAKVIYTPVNVTIGKNGSISMDLNHDGIRDFTIVASLHGPFVCDLRIGFTGLVTINPTTGNGIVVKGPGVAALLPLGAHINPSSDFYKAQSVIIQFSKNPFICEHFYSKSGYLGLEFQIKGETHYGWALVDVFVSPMVGTFDTTLIGFAYETIPGRSINAGQTSGTADAPTAAGPGSMNRKDSGPHIGISTRLRFPLAVVASPYAEEAIIKSSASSTPTRHRLLQLADSEAFVCHMEHLCEHRC